jgi:hypothetical protein
MFHLTNDKLKCKGKKDLSLKDLTSFLTVDFHMKDGEKNPKHKSYPLSFNLD